MTSTSVYISIGSNLGNPRQQVQSAFQRLARLPHTRQVTSSPIYRTAPIGGPCNQPDYINAVARLKTTLTPNRLLNALQAIESAQGRTRAVRWEARTLDLDLLLYGELICDDPLLTVPHPRLHERAFVLYPLHDIAPNLVIPQRGKLVELLIQCPYQAITRLGNIDWPTRSDYI